LSKRLFIGDLENSKTNEGLKESFSSESSVTYVKENRTLEVKLKDFGFVEMEIDEEASKAIIKAVLKTGSFWLMNHTSSKYKLY
jgi:RNA recognition motif-containing protein